MKLLDPSNVFRNTYLKPSVGLRFFFFFIPREWPKNDRQNNFNYAIVVFLRTTVELELEEGIVVALKDDLYETTL